MKTKLLGICLFFVTSHVLAETYYCSNELTNFGRPGEFEYKIYKRQGTQFKKLYTNLEVHELEIIQETTKHIILAERYAYPALFATIINKESLEFVEDFITIDCEEFNCKGTSSKGECLLN